MSVLALIVVDMQNDFLDPQGALYCGERAREVIPRVVALVEQFLKRGDPVFFTQDTHVEGDREFEAFTRHCVREEWGHALVPEVEGFSHDDHATIVPKARYSAFFRTDLERQLEQLKPERVEVCGVCTSICVMDTVGALRSRDYAVRVHKSATADFDPEMHRFALRRMEKIYAAQVE